VEDAGRECAADHGDEGQAKIAWSIMVASPAFALAALWFGIKYTR